MLRSRALAVVLSLGAVLGSLAGPSRVTLSESRSAQNSPGSFGWLEDKPIVRLNVLDSGKLLNTLNLEDSKPATENEQLNGRAATRASSRLSRESKLIAIQSKISRIEKQNQRLDRTVKGLVQQQSVSQSSASQAGSRKSAPVAAPKAVASVWSKIKRLEAQNDELKHTVKRLQKSPSGLGHSAAVREAVKPPGAHKTLPVITSWVEPPPPPPPKHAYPVPVIKQVPRGIHMSLKPHELPEWADDKNGVANHYIDLLEEIMDTVHARNSEINVLADVPASYAQIVVTRGGQTAHLGGLVQSIVDGVVVLTRAVSADQILKQAEPFLKSANGKRVVVGVELRCGIQGGGNLMGTFCGHDLNEMEVILQDADKAMDHFVSYSGMAINDINGYDAMQPVVQLSATLRAPREVFVSTGGVFRDQNMQTRLMKFATEHEVTAMYVEASEAVIDGQQDEIGALLSRAYQHGLKVDLLYSHSSAVLPQHHKAAKHWALSCILAFGHRHAGVYQTPEDFGLRVKMIGVKWDISNKLVIEVQGNSETLEHVRMVAALSSTSMPEKRIGAIYPGKHAFAELRFLPAHSTADVELGLDGSIDVHTLEEQSIRVRLNVSYVFNRNILFQNHLYAVAQPLSQRHHGPWISVGTLYIDPSGSGWTKLSITAVHSLVQVHAICWASNNVTITYPHDRNFATLLGGPNLDKWQTSSFRFNMRFPRGVTSTKLTLQASFLADHKKHTQLFNLAVDHYK